ncbi:MAG: M10 family metallopeptidase C-terminal domain-containing protein, partial [Brevundimonas sp.]
MATVTSDPLSNEFDGSPATTVSLDEITVGPVAAPPLTFEGPLVLPEASRFFGVAEDLVDNIAPAGCQCALCAGLDSDNGSDGSGLAAKFSDYTSPTNGSGPGLFELLNLQRNPDGSYFFTGDRNVDAALIGSKWATLNLTYSFPDSGSEYDAGYANSNYPSAQMELGSFQKLAALDAFRQLSALTGLTFTEAGAGETAIIRISQTGAASLGSAQGHFPSDVANAGDIWFGRTSQPYYDHAEKGSWGFSTMMHEIGHTMGLKHGHQDYTNTDLSFYFGTTPRFGTRALEPQFDGQSWSLMTYTTTPGVSGFGGDKANQPQTYMQFDIAALQYMYGANFNTNAGASIYTWSETTGEMFINGVGQGAPGTNKIYQTIWDGDGVDTYDFSNYNNGISVDLRPGAFSLFSQDQLANNTAAINGAARYAPGNVANALLYNNDVRSLIENATGGAGNDSMIGNVANNVLTGGAGDDVLVGLGGSDRLVGGGGSDTAVFSDSTTGITVTLDGGAGDVTVVNGSDTDIINGVENIVGTAFDDTMTGDALNNRLDGGASGHDVLSGGAGDDQLIGGGFTIGYDTAYSAPDIVKDQATANISIATAVATAGAYDIQPNPNVGDATTIPHATINATAAGGGLEYSRIDVTAAGQRVVFDIDTN